MPSVPTLDVKPITDFANKLTSSVTKQVTEGVIKVQEQAKSLPSVKLPSVSLPKLPSFVTDLTASAEKVQKTVVATAEGLTSKAVATIRRETKPAAKPAPAKPAATKAPAAKKSTAKPTTKPAAKKVSKPAAKKATPKPVVKATPVPGPVIAAPAPVEPTLPEATITLPDTTPTVPVTE